jgi:hypothetical protein
MIELRYDDDLLPIVSLCPAFPMDPVNKSCQ